MKADNNSSRRIADMLVKLFLGKPVYRKKLLDTYGTNIVNRDVADIRNVLKSNTDDLEIYLDRKNGSYKFTRTSRFNIEEIIFLAKLALDSRSLRKDDLDMLLNKMLAQLSEAEAKIADGIMKNEHHNYVAARNNRKILDLLKTFIYYIDSRQAIHYRFVDGAHKETFNIGLPVAIWYAEFYFYVIIYSKEHKRHETRRLERFFDIKPVDEKIHIPYAERMEEKVLRNNTFLLFSGGIITFVFQTFVYPEVILDRFPNSRVLKSLEDESFIYEVTAYQDSARMFVLSQGGMARVLKPASFVEKMKAELEKMIGNYDKEYPEF